MNEQSWTKPTLVRLSSASNSEGGSNPSTVETTIQTTFEPSPVG